MVNVTDFTGGGKMPSQAEQPPAQPGFTAGGEHRPDNYNPGSSAQQGGSQIPKRPFFLDDEPPHKQVPDIDISSDNTVRAMEAIRDRSKFELEKEKEKASRQGGPAFLNPAKPEDIKLKLALSTDTIVQLNYLIEPFLPENQPIGFYGKGETAKSSLLATFAVQIASWASTLWVSVEEDPSWIAVRHTKAGGGDGTLYVFEAIATKLDAAGKPIASNFNIYEHLEPAILKAQAEATENARHFLDRRQRPVRLVVLDTAVALTTWGKGESPNDDLSVKRLFSYLRYLCDTHHVTIAIIGHFNKGKHENISDMVAGSGAWTTSPRQAFGHFRDARAEYGYVIATVKSSLTGKFAASYETEPVHTLFQRADGSDSVLCHVNMGPIQWGHDKMTDLVAEAAGTSEEGRQESMSSRKQDKVKAVIDAVLAGLDTNDHNVTRKTIQALFQFPISGRHWLEAENVLAVAHRVRAVQQGHGLLVYRRQP